MCIRHTKYSLEWQKGQLSLRDRATLRVTLWVFLLSSVEKLTEFLNELDDSHNIKFTYEGGQLPFLDLLLNRTENDGLKLQICRKPIHTDQYLNFNSHQTIEHKLSVVRTLLERSQCLVAEIEDRKQENLHVEEAL